MNGFYGADTGQLRDHSALLRNRARRIGELQTLLHSTVMDSSAWQGPDAEAFRADWSSRTSPLLDRVAADVMRQGGVLEEHAEEQDRTSSAGGGGTSGGGTGGGATGGGGTGGGTPWWRSALGGINDGLGVYNTFQKAYSGAKDVWDIARIIDRSTDFIAGAEDVFQLAAGTWKYGQDITGKVFGAGQQYSGLVSKLVGELPINIPTGLGNKNLLGWVDGAVGRVADAAPFLADMAPWVGKALPALDVVSGGWQMVEGIRSGDTFSAVTGGASALGGGLMLAGGAMSATGVGAVIGGPLVAAGAIISGGAALADAGRMIYENWDSITATASDAWNATTDLVGDAAGAVTETAGNVVDSVSDGFSDAVDGLADALPW